MWTNSERSFGHWAFPESGSCCLFWYEPCLSMILIFKLGASHASCVAPAAQMLMKTLLASHVASDTYVGIRLDI